MLVSQEQFYHVSIFHRLHQQTSKLTGHTKKGEKKKKKKREKKKRGKRETHHSPQPSLDTSIQTLLDFPTSSVGGCVTRKLPVSPAGPPSFGYYLAPQVLR